MAEILLGRPLLKAMGFDFNEHLQCIAPFSHRESEEELQEGKCTLALASYRGVNFSDIEEDPIQLSECLQARFGSDTVTDIAIMCAVDDAKKNGLSAASTEKLQALLKKTVVVLESSWDHTQLQTYARSRSNLHRTPSRITPQRPVLNYTKSVHQA
ncbi:hypothetical protein BWQ96_04278 [Gracilariopsis chorda]|uniref:Uncharacterized protein n=1 Tax=Gracilariopsis chorda TaxID=448386 RepID=A0A2V3IV51_9FLOR|nr:hypothetical protein BWQ96_04278 [Gracilariopsis chorda]|eukprot:PXF45965.1 hypothetical protein BWQ96_04278 [Gracilariopsis chorda]